MSEFQKLEVKCRNSPHQLDWTYTEVNLVVHVQDLHSHLSDLLAKLALLTLKNFVPNLYVFFLFF